MLSYPFIIYHHLVVSGPTWLGLDVSWQMTLNHALLKGSRWGTDIIYSHGPLGFLVSRVGMGISRWVFLLADLFVVVNFYFVFRDFIIRSSNRGLAIIFLVGIALVVSTYYGMDLPWIYLLFTFYWMYKAHSKPRLVYFIMISVLLALSFFAKLNTGLVIFFSTWPGWSTWFISRGLIGKEPLCHLAARFC